MNNLDKEIYKDCLAHNIPINENFLIYYSDLLHLNPEWGLASTTDRTFVVKFKQFAVNELTNQKTPKMITLKLQYYFNCYWTNKEKAVQKNRLDLCNKLAGLENEIVTMQSICSVDDFSIIYKKMTYYIALFSGLGNPTIPIVFKETLAGLKSIVDSNELREFVEEESSTVKEQMLYEFTRLVTGIRLFNKDCNKGGDTIEDLPKLITKAITSSREDIQEILRWVMDTVNMITTALDFVYGLKETRPGKYELCCKLPQDVEDDDIEYLKDYLLVYRQYEIFLRKLIKEVEDLEISIVENIFYQLQNTYQTLHETVRNRLAIPVDQVFPHFNELWNLWVALQDKTIYLSKLNQAVNDMNGYVKTLNFNQHIALTILGNRPPMSDTERMELTNDQRIEQKNNKAKMLYFNDFKDIESLKLQYLGFCAWNLVATEGALLPGNPNLGIATVMNMNYVFSSVEAGIEFGRNPERYVLEGMKLLRKRPELINLLGMYRHLNVIREIKNLVEIPVPPKICADVEIQTLDHVNDGYIDKSYFWSIWDYKRQALQLANLTHNVTTSFQTDKTYGKWPVRTQTYCPREKTSQTKIDNYSNVPKQQNFIFGLRGRRDNKQFIVELTRPVAE